MLNFIDDQLNKLTMYRTVLYSLCLMVVITIVFTITGSLDFSTTDVLASLAIILASGFAVNQLLSRYLKVPINNESGLITELILFFLITPILTDKKILGLIVAAVVATASKFILNYRGKHIFNPAALGVWVVGLIGITHASWWVGSKLLWPFLLIFGILIARKIRRLTVVMLFTVAAVVSTLLLAVHNSQEIDTALRLLITSSPLIFLGTVMLTEPATMPSKKQQQFIFAAVVGLLFATHFKIFGLYIYPETALLIGNVYAFVLSPKRNWQLKLKKRTQFTSELYDYEFDTNQPLNFLPGQYMEWTLDMPLLKQDDRGNRRTFTIASSPTEQTVHLGVRMPQKRSTFKTNWFDLTEANTVFAGQVAGSFVLPGNKAEKLLFIAGGVGITPFRSMVKYLIDTRQERDIILVYAAKNEDEFMYKEIFAEASSIGLRTLYAAGSTPLSVEDMKKQIPDMRERKTYISGPPGMVRGIKTGLTKAGVNRRTIKTDFFSGY